MKGARAGRRWRALVSTCSMVWCMGVACPVFAQQAVAEGEESSRPKLTRNKDREAAARQGDYVFDEKGRRLRVSFPLYERFYLEGQTGALPQGVAASARTPAMYGGRVALAKSFALDFSDEDIWWMMRHRFLDTTYSRHGAGSATLRSTLLSAQYLRHDLSSFVIVPAANDLRLPANFDIATDYRLFDIELSTARAGGERSWSIDQLRVAHIAILMDFIRDEDYRHRFALGVAGNYRITPMPDEAPWVHEVSPLTSAKILYGWDQADGRFHFYTEATCGPSLQFVPSQAAESQAWGLRCQTLTELEWVPIAINDRPISLPLELRTDLPLSDDRADTELLATLGLRISFSRR